MSVYFWDEVAAECKKWWRSEVPSKAEGVWIAAGLIGAAGLLNDGLLHVSDGLVEIAKAMREGAK